jgi:hypothetical protein
MIPDPRPTQQFDAPCPHLSSNGQPKLKHATRDSALDHVKSLVWKNHIAGNDARSAGLTPYPCEHCGAWHVGHEQTAPLAWHYTVKKYLDEILNDDALLPPLPHITSRQELNSLPQHLRMALKRFDEPAPLLWFSRNPLWEHSVVKTRKPWGMARNETMGRGLLRFGVPASYAKLRWPDYLRLNHPHPKLVESMVTRGNASEWLATDEPVPLSAVRAIEVYIQGNWVSVTDIEDEEFDTYISTRAQVYREAAVSLNRKMDQHNVRFTEAQPAHHVVDPTQPADYRYNQDHDIILTEAEHVIYQDLRINAGPEVKKRWPAGIRVEV